MLKLDGGPGDAASTGGYWQRCRLIPLNGNVFVKCKQTSRFRLRVREQTFKSRRPQDLCAFLFQQINPVRKKLLEKVCLGL